MAIDFEATSEHVCGRPMDLKNGECSDKNRSGDVLDQVRDARQKIQ